MFDKKPQANNISAERYKAKVLIEAMSEGVVVIDEAGTITMMNQAAAIITGWTTMSATGLNYRTPLRLSLISDSGELQATDPVSQAMAEKQAVASSDIEITQQNGGKLLLSVTATALPDGGAIVVMRDITKQKELERQKDEFISTASHEMRTPVAAVEGYISLAMNPKVATIDDRAKALLEKAHDSTGHLGTLFRDLLTITRMEDGLKQLPREAVNLTLLTKSVVSDMQFAAASKQLSLQLAGAGLPGNTALDRPVYVMANPERLREVIMNLIENAIKYTPSGSVVVTAGGDGKTAGFSVTDTGPGISAEDQPHLFQKFYRVAKTSGHTSGTGLGLYLCRTVIESFGGHVSVTSAPGKGSTFGFTLDQLSEDDAQANKDLIQPSA